MIFEMSVQINLLPSLNSIQTGNWCNNSSFNPKFWCHENASPSFVIDFRKFTKEMWIKNMRFFRNYSKMFFQFFFFYNFFLTKVFVSVGCACACFAVSMQLVAWGSINLDCSFNHPLHGYLTTLHTMNCLSSENWSPQGWT